MLTYATLNDMLAAAAPSSDFGAFLLGRNSVGDGLGGFYVWSAASTRTHNTGTVITPTGHAGAGRWLRQYTGFVDIRWFGADPTGVADSTNAFILAWGGTETGDVILIPSGTFSVSADNAIVWGGRKWWGKCVDNTVWPTIKARTDGDVLCNVISHRAEIRSVRFDADNRVGVAFKATGSNYSVFEDIEARNATDIGILLHDVSTTAHRLAALACNRGIVLRGCNGSLFTWPMVQWCDSTGLVVEGPWSENTEQSGNCLIVGGITDVNCRAEEDGTEVLLDGVEQAMLSGMYIEAENGKLSTGVRMVNQTHNCSLRDLRFVLNPGALAVDMQAARGCLVDACGAGINTDTIRIATAYGAVGSYDNTVRNCRAISAVQPRSWRINHVETDTGHTDTLTQGANGELVKDSGPPTAGRWRKGDRVGAYQCTVEGYPGTWVAIDAGNLPEAVDAGVAAVSGSDGKWATAADTKAMLLSIKGAL